MNLISNERRGKATDSNTWKKVTSEQETENSPRPRSPQRIESCLINTTGRPVSQQVLLVYQQCNERVMGLSRDLNYKVLLLSLAEIEGPSDFTRGKALLPMSRPCKRPRGSRFSISENAAWELLGVMRWRWDGPPPAKLLVWSVWNCCIWEGCGDWGKKAGLA